MKQDADQLHHGQVVQLAGALEKAEVSGRDAAMRAASHLDRFADTAFQTAESFWAAQCSSSIKPIGDAAEGPHINGVAKALSSAYEKNFSLIVADVELIEDALYGRSGS